ncbi:MULTISPECIES: MFS transporter [unclassified Streptomyces]|uniref:MFS transporter n=1 Tax=unclassified Streptomyces TaxID=2593676 RepID=UPI000C2759BE|nr:MFS transporter [Streptomyces sp. CB02959]PJN30533.1 MFS transporter [Streptomyces sp. CB02959]
MAHTPPHTPPDPRRGGRALLLVLAGNMLIDALEVSVVIVALPPLGTTLGLTPLTAQWIMGGFALGFAALLLLGTPLATRFGRRPLYLAALTVFTLASLAGGLTSDPTTLIATRVLKGTCAALTAPTGLAIITTTYREGPERRRAISLYSFFGAIGFTTGLLLSGALTPLNWRLTFLCTAPAALLLLCLATRTIPHTPTPPPTPARPPHHLLTNGPLIRSALGAATLNGTYLSLLLLATFYLQTTWHWTPWHTALAFLPACAPLAAAALFAGPMVARFGAPRLIALGAAAPLTGYLLALATTPPHSYATDLMPTMALVGIGFVLSFTALNLHAGSALPPTDRPAATALYQTAVQLGAVLLPTATSALLTAGLAGHPPGTPGTTDAYRPPLVLITTAAAAGLAIALWGLRTSKPAHHKPVETQTG